MWPLVFQGYPNEKPIGKKTSRGVRATENGQAIGKGEGGGKRAGKGGLSPHEEKGKGPTLHEVP